MPSRILLISANRCTAPDPVFPLGLTHLTAALRQAGHEVQWFDALTDAELFEAICDTFAPDVVGISLRNIDDVLILTRETFYGDLTSLTARIRQRSRCPIIVGGSGFSIFPDLLLDRAGADYGISGEGEQSFVSLIEALETGGEVADIPGLVYRRKGTTLVNPRKIGPFTGMIQAIDRPSPITTHYLRTSGVLNVQTQRGCGFRCCYCTYPVIEGRRNRARPVDQVVEDFLQLQALGAKYVFIVDSIFNSTPEHVTKVCEALKRHRVRLSWGCFLRPQGLTPDLMRLMAEAGLSHIEFGSDSFCDDVLRVYGKDFTFEDILVSNELARQNKVDCCHFLISGGPGETRETLQIGFRNARQLQGAVILAVAGMRIYPGTHLFDRACEEGLITDATDLLSPAYYVAPGLTAESVIAELRQQAAESPNWIVGDPAPAYQKLVERLRQRGVIGPLWSYFAMMQRLRPEHMAGASTL